MQLCLSWIAISKDGIVGNGQKMATLWAGIRNNFRENFATNQAAVLVDRDDDSFYTRWKTIQKLVLKYTSFFDQVQNGPSPSGSGPNEMVSNIYYDCL